MITVPWMHWVHSVHSVHCMHRGIKHKWELISWTCSICVKSDTGLADLTSVTGSLWIELESHGKVNTCPAIWWWAEELAVVPYV